MTVPFPAGRSGGVVVSVAVTGVPIRSDPVPVAPAIGLPEASLTVTLIESSPSANPVVSRLPRSTVSSVVSTSRVVAMGCEVKITLFCASVTVYETLTDFSSSTALRIFALTSTISPGMAKEGLVFTDVICRNVVRAVSDPVSDWLISGAPSAVAVTVKLNGASSVLEVESRVTVSAGTPVEPDVSCPGVSVTDATLRLPVTPVGRPVRVRS